MPEADAASRPVLALIGPTAAGKSEQAIAAAERVRAELGVAVEIVAVDAFTVYRGMDIGTAKPDAEQRRRVPHHCLDLLDPDTDCTAEWFQTQARSAIADLHGRGVLPLLVGGSGLYFRTVVDPLEFPPTDPTLRGQILKRLGDDPPAAHAILAAADPAGAARIDPSNLRRTVRALEVIELTGRPFSDWRRAWDDHRSIYDLRVVGVDLPREELHDRIERRVDAMIAEGLIEECRALRKRWPRMSLTARQAIGYGEVLDHLAGRIPLGEAVEAIKVRTRRFAARQLRWFRADPRVQWTAHEEVPAALVEHAAAAAGGGGGWGAA